MRGYSVKEVSKKLKINKDTLRYYDKIQLVVPVRESNHYRSYSEQDLQDLKFITVMKRSGFPLHEIQLVLSNKRSQQPGKLEESLQILKKQQQEIEERVTSLQMTSCLLTHCIAEVSNKRSVADVDLLVTKIYHQMIEQER